MADKSIHGLNRKLLALMAVLIACATTSFAAAATYSAQNPNFQINRSCDDIDLLNASKIDGPIVFEDGDEKRVVCKRTVWTDDKCKNGGWTHDKSVALNSKDYILDITQKELQFTNQFNLSRIHI